MPPPELARNAPRLDILQPVVIGLLAALRHDLHAPRTHGVQCWPNDLTSINKPLVGQHRLDHNFRPVAKGLHDFLRLDQRHLCCGIVLFTQLAAQTRIIRAGHHRQPLGRDFLDHSLARRVAVKAAQMIRHKVQRVGLCL